jgi:hypothetical protein
MSRGGEYYGPESTLMLYEFLEACARRVECDAVREHEFHPTSETQKQVDVARSNLREATQKVKDEIQGLHAIGYYSGSMCKPVYIKREQPHDSRPN